jgi:D-alanyl-D-alanine carboxypeptidase
MFYSEPARTAGRRTRSTIVLVLVVVSAALLGVLGYESLAGSSSSATSPIAAEPRALRPPGDPPGALGDADGVVPDGVTVFDDEYPAVANLDPGLHRALRQAATDAARDRVTFYVDSGWRSPKYQEQLLDEAIAKYGSEKEAARWVATPSTSAHVSGDAVDIGPTAATVWLSKHGGEYGLCQIYGNESWHYELRPKAIAHGCPPMYADPTQDPRMQQ